MKELLLNLCKQSGIHQKNVLINKVVIAGCAESDGGAVDAHIVEQEDLRVQRQVTFPACYPANSTMLTTDKSIELIGSESSGGIEFVILKAHDELWVGVGSDHRDQQTGANDKTFSKTLCAKPMADSFWLLKEVIGHWDELILTSHIEQNGERLLYQEDSVTAILGSRGLMVRSEELMHKDSEEGMIMFSGAPAVIGGTRCASKFDIQLFDPVLNRRILHCYEVI